MLYSIAQISCIHIKIMRYVRVTIDTTSKAAPCAAPPIGYASGVDQIVKGSSVLRALLSPCLPSYPGDVDRSDNQPRPLSSSYD
jgi:hypothetical protein